MSPRRMISRKPASRHCAISWRGRIGRAFVAGTIAGTVDRPQHFARLGQGTDQGVIAPRAVVGDVHPLLLLAAGLHQRAVEVQRGPVEEFGRLPPPDVLPRFVDRGVQYASEHYQRVLSEHAITCSMSRTGNCWDNAPMESFFATLKKELVHHENYETRTAARTSLFEYLEVFYNCERLHSSLGYVTPEAFEKAAA
ncbi:MAG: transposase [Planctomycetales bacterium]|nr:transposase [Planctomycetales bacterium]